MGDKTERIFIVYECRKSSPTSRSEAGATALEDVQEFSNVCRTCAAETDSSIPIFSEEGVRKKLAEKIEKYLPIKVSETDTLPRVMCGQCVTTLLAWHKLVESTLKTDAMLKASLESAENPIPSSTNTNLADEEDTSNTVPPAEVPLHTMGVRLGPQYLESRSYCQFCRTWHDIADIENHIVTQHYSIIYYCKDCARYVHVKDMIKHITYHGVLNSKIPVVQPKSHKENNGDTNYNLEIPSRRSYQDNTEPKAFSLPLAIVRPQNATVTERIYENGEFISRLLAQQALEAAESQANDTATEAQATGPISTQEDEIIEETIEPLPQDLETPLQSETVPIPRDSPSPTQDIPDAAASLTQGATASSEDESNSQVAEHTDVQLPTRSRPKYLTCPICSKVYKLLFCYYYHMKYAHVPKKHTCYICNKKLSTRINLYLHISTVHNTNFFYECPKCKKIFGSIVNFCIHWECHFKQFTCLLCDSKFRREDDAESHIQRHFKQSAFVCLICGSEFIDSQDLARHYKIHPAKVYACDECGKTFTEHCYLRVHVITKHPT